MMQTQFPNPIYCARMGCPFSSPVEHPIRVRFNRRPPPDVFIGEFDRDFFLCPYCVEMVGLMDCCTVCRCVVYDPCVRLDFRSVCIKCLVDLADYVRETRLGDMSLSGTFRWSMDVLAAGGVVDTSRLVEAKRVLDAFIHLRSLRFSRQEMVSVSLTGRMRAIGCPDPLARELAGVLGAERVPDNWPDICRALLLKCARASDASTPAIAH